MAEQSGPSPGTRRSEIPPQPQCTGFSLPRRTDAGSIASPNVSGVETPGCSSTVYTLSICSQEPLCNTVHGKQAKRGKNFKRKHHKQIYFTAYVSKFHLSIQLCLTEQGLSCRMSRCCHLTSPPRSTRDFELFYPAELK